MWRRRTISTAPTILDRSLLTLATAAGSRGYTKGVHRARQAAAAAARAASENDASSDRIAALLTPRSNHRRRRFNDPAFLAATAAAAASESAPRDPVSAAFARLMLASPDAQAAMQQPPQPRAHHPLQDIEFPLKRRWFALDQATSSSSSACAPAVAPSCSSSADSLSFTMVSYNMLAQALVHRELFPYCSKTSLKTAFRKDNLLAELSHLRADVLALQEVDKQAMDTFWIPRLLAIGYKHTWGARKDGRHGCAIFYKKEKFTAFASTTVQFSELLATPYADNEDNLHADPAKRKGSVYAEMNRPNVAMIVGLHVKAKQQAHKNANEATADTTAEPLGFYVTNTHLFWDPRYRFVRLKQCQTLLDHLAQLQTTHQTRFPSILAGDWNVTPDNVIHQYLTARSDLEQDEQQWTKFLTPTEHGMIREQEGAVAVAPVPQAELDANSGVSSASLAKLMNAVSSPSPSPDSAISSSPSPSPSPSAPLSNAPIHQLRSKLVVQADGTTKRQDLELDVDHTSTSSILRLSEVKTVLHRSKQLPLLRSVYANYTSIIPEDLRASTTASQRASAGTWIGEPPFTNYTAKWKGTLDYLFMPFANPAAERDSEADEAHDWAGILAEPTCALHATHVLEIPLEEVVSTAVALPNDTLSSDHLSIAARFTLKRLEPVQPVAQIETDLTAALAKSIAASLSMATEPSPSVSSMTALYAAGMSAVKSAFSSASVDSHTTPSAAATAFPPFAPATFQKLLRTQIVGHPLHYTPSTTSTMDLCKEALFGAGANKQTRPTSGALWLADEQTKGRGRVEGRTWESPRNANLYFTLLMQLNDLPWEQVRVELTKLNQTVCLAVAQAIEQTLAAALGVPVSSLPPQLRPRVKWPNDVWIGGRKCSGMLIDSEIMGTSMSAVIGVGLNVHEDMHSHPDPSIRESATSVQQALTDWLASSASSSSAAVVVPVSRESILASFLLAFETLISQSASAVQGEYSRYDLLLGRRVTVMPKKREDPSAYFTARAIEFTPDGFLVVETERGERQTLVAEEVTIRPQD